MDAEAPAATKLDPARQLGQRLQDCYRHIHATAMADVPICNPALGIAATGFPAFGGRAFGIVTTPWFMNLVAIDLPEGTPRPQLLPVQLCASGCRRAKSSSSPANSTVSAGWIPVRYSHRYSNSLPWTRRWRPQKRLPAPFSIRP